MIFFLVYLLYRLHAELRKSVETQLDGAATSLGVLTSDLTEEDMAKNLQEQVQLANQVRTACMTTHACTNPVVYKYSDFMWINTIFVAVCLCVSILCVLVHTVRNRSCLIATAHWNTFHLAHGALVGLL